ncbi:MAG: Threonylcarbamoyladenosine tRNA methylthiotransferase MtaB [Microgenomates group bacterium ADurb.Bin219]|nr:MAG: Threonylcarbamoyladenosine tRNA methylthiotransferase MtaB [Microgenomates group bacterium ADurb.Bin219]
MPNNKNILTPLTFLTYTLGCRVNQAEIGTISHRLSAFGFQEIPPALLLSRSPALVIINTCAVTLKAEKESRKAIHHFKRLYPKAKIVAIGCAAKLVKDADLVISNKEKMKSLKIITAKFGYQTKKSESDYSLIPKSYSLTSSGRSLVKIQEGCDQFCNYCIVPYLRGKPKSTLPREIICQINKLVDQEIKEIILCGINLSLYGLDLTPKTTLTALIKKILKETKAERISLSSIEPEFLYQNLEFVELFINQPRLAKYFHLALQSGSQENLKQMGRKTDLNKLLKTVRFLGNKFPEFAFRADVLVGFPTETEENFKETLDFINKAPITFAHVFPFSTRPGTPAEKMIKSGKWHDLPNKIKKERVKKIMDLTKSIQEQEAKNFIGKILPCLITRKISGGYEAIANNSWVVHISYRPSSVNRRILIGKEFPIKITGYSNGVCAGEFSSGGLVNYKSRQEPGCR